MKIFDENSIEKLNFYLFLGKVVAKNRAFGNNINFLQQFFPVRGGGLKQPTPSPCVRHCKVVTIKGEIEPTVYPISLPMFSTCHPFPHSSLMPQEDSIN